MQCFATSPVTRGSSTTCLGEIYHCLHARKVAGLVVGPQQGCNRYTGRAVVSCTELTETARNKRVFLILPKSLTYCVAPEQRLIVSFFLTRVDYRQIWPEKRKQVGHYLAKYKSNITMVLFVYLL